MGKKPEKLEITVYLQREDIDSGDPVMKIWCSPEDENGEICHSFFVIVFINPSHLNVMFCSVRKTELHLTENDILKHIYQVEKRKSIMGEQYYENAEPEKINGTEQTEQLNVMENAASEAAGGQGSPDDQNLTDKPEQRHEKKAGRPMSSGRRWASVVAMGLVFGLVAGGTMFGGKQHREYAALDCPDSTDCSDTDHRKQLIGKFLFCGAGERNCSGCSGKCHAVTCYDFYNVCRRNEKLFRRYTAV